MSKALPKDQSASTDAADFDAELAEALLMDAGDAEDMDDDFEDEEELQDELTDTNGEITFESFNLPPVLAKTLEGMGYTKPTPVQAQAIPLALAGRDVLATAQTGTGKTAAFAVPLLSGMLNGKRSPVLILAPTRELAEQIAKVIQQLTVNTPQLKTVLIIGGSSYQYQIRGLKSKPAFVVGTPGRMIDQAGLGNLKLGTFGSLVLDEADRMLDMGFAPQLEQLISQMPVERQTLLFSATLPNEIKSMAARYMKSPERVACGESTTPVDRIKQEVIEVENKQKGERLLREIDNVEGSLIIFTRTKTRVEQVLKLLVGAGHRVARIHGDRSQRQRGDAIRDFREGHARILVATDIAARGIDIPHIKFVVNFDLPLCPEDYIHRIGRTARAGADGTAWAFVTPEETFLWARIYKMMYNKYPEGFDRRRSGGARSSGPSAGGRFGRSGGGGRGFERGGGSRFGGGRSGGNPFGGRDDRRDDRRDISAGPGRDERQRSFSAPRPDSRPDRMGPGSMPFGATAKSSAPMAGPSSKPSSVSAPSSAPSVRAERMESRPEARAEPRAEARVEARAEVRVPRAGKPVGTFAADIIASASQAQARPDADATLNRAARRASKFSSEHRENMAREGNRQEDSQIRQTSPARASDAAGARGPRGAASSEGDRRPRTSGSDERPARRPAFGASGGDRPSFGGGERRSAPTGDRLGGFGGGERRPFSGGGERRPFAGDRPSFGGGERRPFSGGGERRPFAGDRPSFGGSERRPFGGGGERRPFGGGGERRPFAGDRPSFGGGERRPFGGNREGAPRGPRAEGGGSFGESRGFGSRPAAGSSDRGASSPARAPKRFTDDRDARPAGERPPTKRGRFAERLSEMLGQ